MTRRVGVDSKTAEYRDGIQPCNVRSPCYSSPSSRLAAGVSSPTECRHAPAVAFASGIVRAVGKPDADRRAPRMAEPRSVRHSGNPYRAHRGRRKRPGRVFAVHPVLASYAPASACSTHAPGRQSLRRHSGVFMPSACRRASTASQEPSTSIALYSVAPYWRARFRIARM